MKMDREKVQATIERGSLDSSTFGALSFSRSLEIVRTQVPKRLMKIILHIDTGITRPICNHSEKLYRLIIVDFSRI